MAAQGQREIQRVLGDQPSMNVLENSTGAIMFPDRQKVATAASNRRHPEFGWYPACRGHNPKSCSQCLVTVHKLAPNSVRAGSAAVLLLPDCQKLVPRCAASNLRFTLANTGGL